jgi:hypothetical protein
MKCVNSMFAACAVVFSFCGQAADLPRLTESVPSLASVSAVAMKSKEESSQGPMLQKGDSEAQLHKNLIEERKGCCKRCSLWCRRQECCPTYIVIISSKHCDVPLESQSPDAIKSEPVSRRTHTDDPT